MSHSRPIVSPEFRNELLALAPGLSDNAAYWRFASYLLFPSRTDHQKGRILVPQETIYDCLGGRGNVSAYKRVEEFSQKVWPVDLSTWIYGWATKENECRYVKSMRVPDGLKELVETELRKPFDDGMVYLEDGRPFSSRAQKRERDFLYEKANNVDLLANIGCEEAWQTLNYLNNLAPNRFTKILAHMNEAIEIAKDVKDSRNQLALLRLIQVQSKPYYKPVSRSTRIYSMNASFLRLASPVRKVLTQDWIQADLASCQLAVCAAKWGDGIPEIEKYLTRKRDEPNSITLWKDLSSHMRKPYSEELKAILKDALYAIVFGQGDPKSQEYFLDCFPDDPGVWTTFQSHPIIAALLRARALEFERIKSAGFGIDAFGNRVHPTLGDNNRRNWPSVLAICAQSYELALLFPVIELAKEHSGKKGFEILMWLHDGLAFICDRYSMKEFWKDKIKGTVDQKAIQLGIPTWLEIT